MSPKKAAPLVPKMIPTKESFFSPKRTMMEKQTKSSAVVPLKKEDNWPRPQRLLYDPNTCLPYAEIVDNVAICLDTGVELFRFGESYNEERREFGKRFDFKPPGGVRHPSERFVDVEGLVKAGILAEKDVASQKSFEDEEIKSMMDTLAHYYSEIEEAYGIENA